MVYMLLLILFAVGLYGILSQRNLIKIIISLMILEFAVNLFFVAVGFRAAGAPLDEAGKSFAPIRAVDPFPQAMVLTAIVIGLGVLVLLVAIALRLHQRYGTYDINEMRRLRG